MKTSLQQFFLSKKFFSLVFLISSFTTFAQITSTPTGGDWNATSTWVGGNVPQATDNVTIATGATVNQNDNGFCNNLTINGSLLFNTIYKAITVTGITTINNNGVIDFIAITNTSNIRSFNDIVVNTGGKWNSQSYTTISGNVTNNGTFTTLSSNSLTFSGENKTFSGSNIVITANVIINGSYTNNSTDLKFDGSVTGTGTLINTANKTLYLNGAANTITNLDLSATPNTVVYGRLGTQTIKAAAYYNLSLEGSNVKSLQQPLNVNNTLQISTGATLYDNGYAITGSTGSTLNIDGDLQLGSAASATALPTTFGTLNINEGSTIHYSSTNATGQVIDHTQPYYHLRISGNNPAKKLTGNLTILGNLTISSGTLDLQAFNLTVNGDILNFGTQIGTGKVILNGATVNHFVRGIFTNVELNDEKGASLSSPFTINGTLEMTLGPLRMESYVLTINGNIIGDGQSFLVNGQYNNGDLVIGGSEGGSVGDIYMAPSPNNTIRIFTMNRTGEDASVKFVNPVILKLQCNLDNGKVIHSGNVSLGYTYNAFNTRIVNGTFATPPIFNTFTGSYGIQYGNTTMLTQNIITGAQGEIPVNNTVNYFTLNNNTQFTISLAADITVSNILALTAGTLLLGENNMTATYTGVGPTGSVNSFIVTNGNGQFFRTLPAAIGGSYNFPVGYNNGYSLANINFTNNTNMFAGKVGVKVIGMAPPVGETESYLKKHWIFSDDRQGDSYSYIPTFTFGNFEVNGVGADLNIGRFNGSEWEVFPPSTSTATTITLQSDTIHQPLSGENVLFTALSEPLGEILPSNVWDVIVNHEDLSNLESAILSAELDEALKGQGPFTVFDPTDAAFAAIPTGILDSLNADPLGALADVIRYHVVSGSAIESEQLTDGQTIVTLYGQPVTVGIIGNNITINNALITVRDLMADNGVVHIIDAVLIPTIDETIVNNIFSNKVNIYPNPANESFFIACTECTNANYVVMTMDGKIVRTGRLTNEREQIIKGDLSAGIYIVKIIDSKGSTSKKIIID